MEFNGFPLILIDFLWIFNDFHWIPIDFLIFVSFTRPKRLFSNIICGGRRMKGEGNTCIYMYLSLHELVGILARVFKTALKRSGVSFAFLLSHRSFLRCSLVGIFGQPNCSRLL